MLVKSLRSSLVKKKNVHARFSPRMIKKNLWNFFFFLYWKPFHKHVIRTYYSGKINTMTRTMHHNKVYNTHGPMTAAKKAPPPHARAPRKPHRFRPTK